jgi:O-antigen/teichoic acid export membrane protein
MIYGQLTSLFRVEERPIAFVSASIANIFITVGATVLLVVGLHKGATGAVVGNFLGTLAVYFALLAYRRYQLGFEFDRDLLRKMNHFGLPLVPSALALWAINFVDRFFVAVFKGQGEVGVYSLAVRASSVIVFLMVAFQLAWPAFAYSIDDDAVAKRTYAFVLTYLLLVCCWASVVLGLLSPWIVRVLAPEKHAFWRASEAVGILSFAGAAYAGYTVLAIGIGRARRTQFNWIVTGAAAALNVALNFALIPPYGMIGAAISTLAAYVAMFIGMSLNAQRVWPVPYQWRRVLTLALAAAALLVLGKAVGASLPLAIVLCLVYPLVLLPLRFYLPAELRRLRLLRIRRMAA